MRRTFIVLAASTFAVGALVASGAGTAFAGSTGPKPVKVACTTLSGNVGGTPTISGCTQSAVTGGSGTFVFAASPTGTITVNWASAVSTTANYSSTILPSTTKADKCPVDPTVAATTPPTKETEVILHGAVSPPGNGGVKGALAAKICLTSTLDLSLQGGQFKI